MLLRIHPIWSYAAMNFEAFPSIAHRDKDGLCLENSSDNLQKSLATSFADAAIPSEAGLRTTLLANDPIRHLKILTAIDDELSHARSFSISVAFITKSGIAPLLLTLQRLAAKGVHGRILTTDYLYFTEPGALRQLLALPNLEVRFFRTQGAAGFHTKGYIFHSSNNLLRIIIGSSNLTLSALTTNREWNTRIVACERGELAQSILAEFDALWSDAASRDAALEMEAYEQEYRQLGTAQLEARKAAVNAQPTIKPGCAEPNSMQQAFLARLKALRSNGAERALLISATGTGKTFAAAFAVRDAIAQFQRTHSADTPRDRECRHSQRFRMLFIVHREQIARQALKSFRIVLGDAAGSFGLLSGNEKASECDFVFATMQTLAKTAVLQAFPKDAFAFIIIDEVHRAGAPSYQRIMNWFKPAFWLGMTGSPERTDGFDIFKLFDHVIAHEIRLSEALEENLLTPFHYFGLSAGTEDETGEGAGQLPDFTNPNWPERIEHVIHQAEYFGSCGDRVKGLIIAGSLEEARAAAAAFTRAGHPAIALDGQTAQDEREAAIERLTHGMGPNRLEYIATVDIFNEGVDIPEVNQILMLRRTESAIVFVQQLGRGLRRAADKEYVIVLDFIGNYEKNYLIATALSDDRSYSKEKLRRFVTTGAERIPGASSIHFDEVARSRIYRAIDSASLNSVRLLLDAYKLLKYKLGRIPELADFEEHASIDASKFLLRKGSSYYVFLVKYEPDYSERLSDAAVKRLRWCSNHLGSALRPSEALVLQAVLEGRSDLRAALIEKLSAEPYSFKASPAHLRNVECVMTAKFERTANDVKRNAGCEVIEAFDDVEDGKRVRRWRVNPQFVCALADEPSFRRRLELLTDFVLNRCRARANHRWEDTFLLLGSTYTYEDVCRLLDWDRNITSINIGGYFYDEKTQTFPIFINYEKQAGAIAYADRFISPAELISLSKVNRQIDSQDAQRMTQKGQYASIRILLFVRRSKEDDEAKAFYFLGAMHAAAAPQPVRLANGQSAFEMHWRLETPVEEGLYEYLTGRRG